MFCLPATEILHFKELVESLAMWLWVCGPVVKDKRKVFRVDGPSFLTESKLIQLFDKPSLEHLTKYFNYKNHQE